MRAYGVRTPHVAAICIGCLTGVGAASAWDAVGGGFSWVLAAAGVAAVVGTVTLRRPRRALAAVFVIAATFGALRFLAAASGGTPDTASLDRASAVLSGRVIAVTRVAGDRMAVRVADVRVAADTRGAARRTASADLALRRPVTVWAAAGGADLRYGDVVRARCTFRAPRAPRDRLTSDGSCAPQAPRDLQATAHGAGSPTLGALDRLHRTLVATIERSVPEPSAGVLTSILLGVRRAVDPALADAFRRTGTIHILVVSGAHMTLIGIILRAIAGMLPIRRRTAALATLAAVAAFTAMVGAAPSAVRGALVYAAIVAAELLGRVAVPVRALLLAATVMVLVHPAILAYDLGFQLSIAATAGILLVAPIVERAVSIRRAWVCEVVGLLAASAAASIATAPLLAHAFGTITLLGPFVNIPVLLLLPGILTAGLALLAAHAIAPALVPTVAWAADVLTRAIIAIVERAAAIPWVRLPAARPSGAFVFAVSALLAIVVIRWYRRRGIPLLTPRIADAPALTLPVA